MRNHKVEIRPENQGGNLEEKFDNYLGWIDPAAHRQRGAVRAMALYQRRHAER
jgi:hypothetical protein